MTARAPRAAGPSLHKLGCAWHTHFQCCRTARGAVNVDGAAGCDHAVGDPVETATGLDFGATGAVVFNTRPNIGPVAVVLAHPHRHSDSRSSGVFGCVGQTFGDSEVHGCFCGATAAVWQPHIEIHRNV